MADPNTNRTLRLGRVVGTLTIAPRTRRPTPRDVLERENAALRGLVNNTRQALVQIATGDELGLFDDTLARMKRHAAVLDPDTNSTGQPT